MSQQWFLAPFRHLLHDHRLWGMQRRWIVPAFATGLFVAFLPFPGHTLVAALVALGMRINIPVAAVTTWVSNPVTMYPIYYFAYQLGARLLDIPPQPFNFELSLDWVTHTFVNIWQPMLLGSVLLGCGAAVLGYVGLDLLWRMSIGQYKARKRSRRNDAGSG
ncbi:MAG: DUF2062 domain-containing protein [Woeseiaceae bacterium]|nr:DUF2062 domain-containing protein [Woeseiaceae bacterium]